MKALKSLVITSSIAAALAGTAFANTVQIVYIAGAPAYRQDSNTNIINNFITGHTGAGITATSGASSSNADVEAASANEWLVPNFFGTGSDLEINASYTGSTAGIEAVTAGRTGTGSPYQVTFLKDSIGSVSTPTTGEVVSGTVGPDFSNKEYPDLSLSDTFQGTTPFTGSVTEKGPTNTTTFTANYADLSGAAVQLGIEPYVFVASVGAAAKGLTNITTSQAQLLYKNGALPLAFFTGNSSDEGTLVYGLSRDPGSGARLGLVTETGIGTKTLVKTYKPAVTGGTTDAAGNSVGGSVSALPSLYPAGLIPSTGVWDNSAGDTGYSSFGSLLSAVTATHTGAAAGAIFVTYFNLADGKEAINNSVGANAETLSYNGTTSFSPSNGSTAVFNQAAVQEGKYTFWAYEFLYPAPSAGTAASSVISTLEGNWTATTPLSSVNVSRLSDGGPVLQNY
jgi:hypothetical protein